MHDFDPEVRLRLTRYLVGDCAPAEMAEVEAWLAADPTRQRELDALRVLWETSAGIPPSDRVDEMWGNVARQIRDGEQVESAPAPPASPRPVLTLHRGANRPRAAWQRWGLGVAAAASVAVAVAYGVQGRSRPGATALPPTNRAAKEYRTTNGQRAMVQLGDGTRIELGVASVLRVYPFTGGRRDVELDGEGVFEVVHDAARPFTVLAGNARIEDLGTRFGVRAYRGDGRVRVVVAEGKVALRPDAARPDTAAVLLPGDLGAIDESGHTQVRRVAVPEAYFGWISGRLLFDNVTLAEVAADLQRWYDVDVTFAVPSLAARRVTVSMPVGALTDALDAVTAPLGLRYERHGAAVLLRVR